MQTLWTECGLCEKRWTPDEKPCMHHVPAVFYPIGFSPDEEAEFVPVMAVEGIS